MANSRSINYSKWDNIELSDDESDLHPNIDKDSWFRMKHRSRLEKEEKEDIQIKGWEKENEQNLTRISLLQAKLKRRQSKKASSAEDDADDDLEDYEANEGEIVALTKKVNHNKAVVKEIYEKRSWNSDNIAKVILYAQ